MNIIKEITAGIDISKSKLDICIKNHSGTLTTADFSNDTVGAKLMLELLVKHGCIDVAMESTGPYWYGIYDYLTEHGISVTLVNPAKAKTHLLNKTDEIDCDVLATLHMINQLKASYVPDHDVRRLRRLTRFKAWLVDMKTAVKNQTTATVSKYSSNILSVFSDAFGVSGKRFLKMLAEGKSEDELIAELDGLKKLTAERRSRITQAISNAFKPNLDPWIIQFSSDIISTIESRVKVLDDAIAKAIDSIPRIKEYVNRILTIKGVGLDTAQAMAAEIADVSRFETSGSLVRYSGINPTLIQSGSVRKYGKLEKGGPPHLRRALCQAARSMAFEGPPNYQRHYNAVRARYGKKMGHGVGVVSTARKLARLIWAMLTNQTDFIDSPKILTERKLATLRGRVKRFDSNSNKENTSTLKDLLLNLHKLDPGIVEMLAEL
jgi:transposase